MTELRKLKMPNGHLTERPKAQEVVFVEHFLCFKNYNKFKFHIPQFNYFHKNMINKFLSCNKLI